MRIKKKVLAKARRKLKVSLRSKVKTTAKIKESPTNSPIPRKAVALGDVSKKEEECVLTSLPLSSAARTFLKTK